MNAKFLSRSIIFLLGLVAALSLAAGQSGVLPRGTRSGSEVLVGVLSCQPNPFDQTVSLTFVVQGTIDVRSGGMGELVGTLITAPEDPCPAVTQAASERVQGLGCVTGPVANGSLTFVCHAGRDDVLEVMATVSEGVVTASF